MAGEDSYTSLLLHCNGADASTTFTDEAGKSMTANGDAQLDTANKKFGSASGLFDGTGDYVSAANSADFDFSTGDWTVDYWVRRNGANATAGVYGSTTDGGDGLSIGFATDSSGKIRVIWDNTEKIVSGTAITNLTWTHVAVVRSGNTVTVYRGGTADGTDDCTGDTIASSGAGIVIGRLATNADDYYFTGHVDEIRVSKGIARWTSNFTPPAVEYGSIIDSPGGFYNV
jgi:hypothetical protein